MVTGVLSDEHGGFAVSTADTVALRSGSTDDELDVGGNGRDGSQSEGKRLV